ncbi:MAG: cytochrome c3 family protein [bacterium]
MNKKIVLLYCLFSLVAGHHLKAQEMCIQCHPERTQKTASQHFKKYTCTQCHMPHASKFKYLLITSPHILCLSCHPFGKEESLQYNHTPFQKRECLQCHDPHENSLVIPEAGLCFRCHKDAPFRKQIIHLPVKKGQCTQSCHLPHASSNEFLLFFPYKSSAICLDCHPFNKETHTSYPYMQNFSKVNCLSCHTPHSSERDGLVFSNLHSPFKKKECQKCHSLHEKKEGGNLCYTCHMDARKKFLSRSTQHLTGDKEECTICHNPHGAERKSLVRTSLRRLCTRCHDINKKYGNLTPHPEVAAGRCSTCHNAHSSDNPKFFQKEIIALCTECHKRQGKHCHPSGEKFIDKRNNTPITCITCHNPMGTQHTRILRLSGSKELCQQCHKDY